MGSNQATINSISEKLEYYDKHARKIYNLNRCSLIKYSFSSKSVRLTYKDIEATIDIKLSI